MRDLVNDDNVKTIVRTIISMAHSLNLQVIAEGVEIAEQHAYLKQEGCDHFQGYFFNKPAAIDEFEKAMDIKKSNTSNKTALVTRATCSHVKII